MLGHATATAPTLVDVKGMTMQFGIFSVGDITQDPTTGYTPSEAERIQATIKIAVHAEEVGLDVFALGEHHNAPFYTSSPVTVLAGVATLTKRSFSRRPPR